METLRLAWADPDLRTRILFVLVMFGVFALGVHIPVPIPGVSSGELQERMKDNAFFALLDTFGGGALRRISIFSLGLNPYITSSIILQILTTANPVWKKELQEGGEYARRQQNKRTRLLTLVLCVFQGMGLLQIIAQGVPMDWTARVSVLIFWTAGAMFILWLGEQISERGIGNGVSLMIFAGIVISLPYVVQQVAQQVKVGAVSYVAVAAVVVIFLATTWFIVYFTTAQRRIPIQHMRRMVGTKVMQGGTQSYLPLSVNLAGVIPIIFAISLVYLPAQFQSYFPADSGPANFFGAIARYLSPNFAPGTPFWEPLVGASIYMALIFFFTYFYTAIQYNVDDIANNLKRAGSFVPGVRPGKQTRDFLDGVISRITVVGAGFLSAVALVQFIVPGLTNIRGASVVGGTTLLIMVTVALETMRQIEANLLMKHYGS
jgi:preprotein translocase subunit SecY